MGQRIGLALILGIAVFGCGNVAEEVPPPAVPEAQPVADIAAAAPDEVSVVLENEWVRVMRFTLEPGSELPRHRASDRIVYSLSDSTIEWVEGDAAATEMSWSAGEVHRHAGVPHAVRNTGAGVAEYFVVERMAGDMPAREQATAEEVPPSAPDHGQVLLEDEAFRVVEFSLDPGASTGRHQGGYRAVIALSDLTIMWTEGEAEPVEVSWSEGQAHWHAPGDHEVENAGESVARYLVVTLLR